MSFNLSSLRLRKTIARVWLSLAIIAGSWAAALGESDQGGVRDGILPKWLEFLVELEIAHIIVHTVIFGMVALLLGGWGRGSRQLAWRYIIVGAVIMEVFQVILGIPHDSLPALVWGVGVDLVVDGVAGWLGLWMVDQIKTRVVPFDLTPNPSPNGEGS
jgi:hypothetical protein